MESRPLVLFIDDEKPILSALSRLLRNEPYDVVMTDDPEVAFDHIRSGKVDLVVADYRMPGISGTGLLQVVKASSPATIRIMLTGYPLDDWIRSAEENGLMRVCSKPWDDGRFKQLIREQLALSLSDSHDAASG